VWAAAQERRIVIAFFPEVSRASATTLKLRKLKARVSCYPANTESESGPYSHLRLSGESLILCRSLVQNLSQTIQTLQAGGARSIFLTAGESPKQKEASRSAVANAVAMTSSSGELQKTFDRFKSEMDAARDYLVESVRLGHPASPAAQWVIDNAYLIKLNLGEIRKELREGYRRHRSQMGRLVKLAQELVDRTGGRVSEDPMVRFLEEAQREEELDSGQIWAFPLFLRIVLIEDLTELAHRLSRAQQLREAAFLWADRIVHSSNEGPAALHQVAQRLRTEAFAQDPTFLTALAEQLQDQETALHSLAREGLSAPLSDLVRAEHEREAADALQAANAFGTLRTISRIDYRRVFEAVSRSEAELRSDPAGIYSRSDFATRDRARQVVASIARQTKRLESEVARSAVGLARAQLQEPSNQVLYYLIAEGIRSLERAVSFRPSVRQRTLRTLRRHGEVVYLGSIALMTLSFCVVAAGLAWDRGIHQPFMLALLAGLAAFPLSELAIQALHSLLISTFPPELLPKLDYQSVIPEESATLVVVPMMLSSRAVVQREVQKLEIRYLANRQDHLMFSLFSDFVDSDRRVTPQDTELLAAAREGIAELNRKYGGDRFVLFHRPRTWSATQQCWIGRERKRGKLEDLNSFLAEGVGDFIQEGRLPYRIRYAISLDADTQLPPGTALRMVETIAHPLNRVRIDPELGIRRRGFTIIQPRVSIALPGATATRFTRIFSDAQGTDPYCTAVSDAQQDLLGEAIFHGKAIYDVQSFHQILNGRFPEETLLSHDLIEGAHVGVGLASDIELLENLPLDYPAFAERQHRWIRGDWQIAGWAMRRVRTGDGHVRRNPLTVLNRWRLLDNLRRSLVPVASLLLLVFGMFFTRAPAVWSIVLGVAIAVPALVPVLDRWSRHIEGSVYGWQGAADDLKRAFVMIVFLPHLAWISADAIVRVFHRKLFSKLNLLEWRTSDAAEHGRQSQLDAFQRQMQIISVIAAASLAILAGRGAFLASFVFLGLWIASPLLARWLEGPDKATWIQPIGRADAAGLRQLARRTWRYFDDLVGPQSRWLPPDNSQLALRVEVARRTSPTNIGLWLNSALAARDFGYITGDDFVRRCSATMDTLNKLERYEGHFLNWYDIDALTPLPPQYVSTVDSGNLIASLWVIAAGCRDIAKSPVIGPFSVAGLEDCIEILRSHAGNDPSLNVALRVLRQTVRAAASAFEHVGLLRLMVYHGLQLKEAMRWNADTGDQTSYWTAKLIAELDSWSGTIDRYLRWMEVLSRASDELVRSLGTDAVSLRRQVLLSVPSFQDLADGPTPALAALFAWRSSEEIRPEVADWLATTEREFRQAQANATEMLSSLKGLEMRVDKVASEINMRFLFDRERRLFGIGYAVGNPVIFNSHYDLLASECRVASLVSIAKGDVPLDHWFTLARPRVSTPSRQALLSWSGTMFEYLMPLLYTEAFENSLLARACDEAVEVQMSYSSEQNLPWGISECAYSALDAGRIYQYRAFGVPGLALNPNVDPGPVVAPYATVMALMVVPDDAMRNLNHLAAIGLSGPMGFYESVDYTRAESKDARPGIVIFAYMAHHQGMSLLALSNVLRDHAVQRRFHSDPRIQAVESLLFERVPITRVEREEVTRASVVPEVAQVQDRVWTEKTRLPHVQLSSNGRYSLMISNNGTGYSRWKGFDVTRWRSDTALDPWGSFIWLRDQRSGVAWSPTPRPFGEIGEGSVAFSADRATFVRRVQDVETKLEVTVTASDAELRRLTINNRSLRTRYIEISSYLELALAPHSSDLAHPVFSRLFIETEALGNALIAHRRQRSPDEPTIWVACVLVGIKGTFEYETDRRVFLGRMNTLVNADGLKEPLKGTTGAVLDPIFSFRARLALEPREQQSISFVLMAASSRRELLASIEEFERPHSAARSFEMAWNRAQLEFRHLRISQQAANQYQELASHLLYPSPRLRATGTRPVVRRGQRELWRYGISGDLPLLVVTIADSQGLELVRQLMLAHAYWRMRGFEADLVILNREATSYDAPLQKTLTRLVQAHASEGSGRGQVFLLDWNVLPSEDRGLLLSCGVLLSGHRGPLQQQLLAAADHPVIAPLVPSLESSQFDPIPLSPVNLVSFNGSGGFTPDGREYVVELGSRIRTPAPWANVIANETFGTVVTESGLGFTWHGNSQTNRLTPWHNDPVCDPQSEAIYVRDEQTARLFSPTPLPLRDSSPYRIRHGQGYTRYEHNREGIALELTVFVPRADTVKISRLRLRNDSKRARLLSVTAFVDWVLGTIREQQQAFISTAYDSTSSAIMAQQSWTGAFAGNVAFLASVPAAASYCGNRISFFGRDGSPEHPDSLNQAHLDNQCGSGLDPCGVLQVTVSLLPGEERDIVLMLGQASTSDAAKKIIDRYKDFVAVEDELRAVIERWDRLLGTLEVHSPAPAADFLLNRWLLYQALSCRIWGRSAVYQSSGALGFRDQLQDCLALIYSSPDITRAHILRAAAHQFEEGDVQHWWHQDLGLGVRTRCSDDLLWLPWAVARYLEITQDTEILDVEVPFLEGPQLQPEESERMFESIVSDFQAPLREHCRRAIERASRFGSHGLPLIGSGDWNDGMNLVGVHGKGESVWLAWFLMDVLNRWVPVVKDKQPDLAALWKSRAEELLVSVDRSAWDGDWYLRGFFDDGSPLGSHSNREARIDSLPQSWSVLSGGENQDRMRRGMDSAEALLVRPKEGLVLLLAPPFDSSSPHPGYIEGYPPGTRENGGQYTHAAIWLAQARARMGDGNAAVRLLQLINPVERTKDPAAVAAYRGEPYAVAADVSASPLRAGVSGWTWYTGSAGWMYRVWIEDVFGFHLRGDQLHMRPEIPEDWQVCELNFRFRSSLYRISLERVSAGRTCRVDCDGQRVAREVLHLRDDGREHLVRVRIGVSEDRSDERDQPDPSVRTAS
jgi:cyclic beta-1,2-glucan synthetase